MTKNPAWLLDYSEDTYSQTGEDGIIAKIFELLPERDKWSVEFGAWDGKQYCSSATLVEKHGYSSVLIEADPEKFKALRQNYSANPKVIAINKLVGFDAADNLDVLLRDTPVPRNFDLLTIDIDGCDYHVWEAISAYTPKLVCVEFNPTIPSDYDFVQPAEFSVSQGSSFSALAKLGKRKGYELVCATVANAFFVLSEYFPLFEISDNRPEAMQIYRGLQTRLFIGYDGRIFLIGNRLLPWHTIELRDSDVQRLPKFLQKYPPNYSFIENILYIVVTRPVEYLVKRPGGYLRSKLLNILGRRPLH